jgi:DNA-binding HxlR family transcriptional regulator
MKGSPGNAVLSPPDPFLERRLGHQLYSARSGLQLEILDTLVRSPGSRYVDLQGLLRGRGDQVLTDALHTLQEEALVLQRGLNRKHSTYQLTTLGVAVRDVIVELRAADRNSAAAKEDSLPSIA